MRNKNLVLFACVLIVLVGIYMVQKRSSRISVVETGIERLLPDQDLDKVVEIRARQDGREPAVILQKTEDSWIVPNYYDARADKHKIESFLKDIENLQGEKRASSKELFPTFAVGDDQALRVDFLGKDRQPLLVLLVGKPGPMGRGCFVRFMDKTDVYLIDNNLLTTFGIFGEQNKIPHPKIWADLKILAPGKDTWSRVELTLPQAAVIFAKEQKAVKDSASGESEDASVEVKPPAIWLQKEPETPKLEDVDIQSTLNALDNLRATQLMDPAKTDYGLEDPTHRAAVALDDGTSLQLLFAQPEAEGPVYVKIKDNKQVYEIPDSVFKNLFDKVENQVQPKKASDDQPTEQQSK